MLAKVCFHRKYQYSKSNETKSEYDIAQHWLPDCESATWHSIWVLHYTKSVYIPIMYYYLVKTSDEQSFQRSNRQRLPIFAVRSVREIWKLNELLDLQNLCHHKDKVNGKGKLGHGVRKGVWRSKTYHWGIRCLTVMMTSASSHTSTCEDVWALPGQEHCHMSTADWQQTASSHNVMTYDL